MDEDPDFDYEMDPQTAYMTRSGDMEEIMDDAGSEGMAMSDAGSHPAIVDKASFDVDFQDSADPQHASSDVQFNTDPTEPDAEGHLVDEAIVETRDNPSQDHIHETTALVTSEAGPQAPVVAISTDQTGAQPQPEGVVVMAAMTARQNGDHHESADHWQRTSIENQEEYAEEGEDEQDELDQGDMPTTGHHLSVSTAKVGTTDEEASGEQEQETNGEGAEAKQAMNGSGAVEYYHSDKDEISPVRITFNGQDFVMWASTDIPAYVCSPTKLQETATDNDADELIQVEAPALEVHQDVLWQPLDSLFAGLRERKALGDFLEETQELHLHFPDLDLDVAEDNLYCRELTLDDLLQLHHGLGLETSLHVQVSERPRFITKYNELAQHVAGILGSQLQHSSDDEDELANAGHAAVAGQNQLAGLQNGEEASSSEKSQATLPTTTETPLEVREHKADAFGETRLEAQSADEHPPVSSEAAIGHVSDHSHSEEQSLRQEISEIDASHEEQDELDGKVAEPEATQAEEADPQEDEEAHEDASIRQVEQGAEAEEEEIDLAAEDEGDEDEYEDEAEGEEFEEEEGGGDYEGHPPAEVYDEEGDPEEYAEYGEEAEDLGEEAEQTFYTSINEGSGAEEDELEEPNEATLDDENAASLLHNAYPTATPEPATTHEATSNKTEAWQDEAEDQVVEYTEEESASLATSTLHNAASDRKRSFVDEDDTAEYEEDEREADSKRVKVD